jgi:hypothetical protein
MEGHSGRRPLEHSIFSRVYGHLNTWLKSDAHVHSVAVTRQPSLLYIAQRSHNLYLTLHRRLIFFRRSREVHTPQEADACLESVFNSSKTGHVETSLQKAVSGLSLSTCAFPARGSSQMPVPHFVWIRLFPPQRSISLLHIRGRQ